MDSVDQLIANLFPVRCMVFFQYCKLTTFSLVIAVFPHFGLAFHTAIVIKTASTAFFQMHVIRFMPIFNSVSEC